MKLLLFLQMDFFFLFLGEEIYLKVVVVFCVVELEKLRSLGYWDAAEELVCTIFSLE